MTFISFESFDINTWTIALSILILSLFYLKGQVKRDQPFHELTKQATVSKTRNNGETAIYRNHHLRSDQDLVDHCRGFHTAYELFWSAVERYPENKFLGTFAGKGKLFLKRIQVPKLSTGGKSSKRVWRILGGETRIPN
jgi:hypothetical protein